MSSTFDADKAALVRRALVEDLGSGDVTTSATVAADARARALITQKAPGVIYGLDLAESVFRELDPDVRCQRLAREGVWREEGEPVLGIESSARALLSAERTALNFLCHLSGVASMAARAVRAVAGTGAKVLDTRKTTPGLRALEKAAVAAGGAENHRAGLYDAILIKENHIAAAGSITAAIAAARAHGSALKVEVEVETPQELEEALAAAPDIIMLDEFSLSDMRAAVALRDARAVQVKLEASGSVSLPNVRAVAETGVDYISVGAITKHVRAVDLSLRLEFGGG
jgi:nicotinate-nucleotide pyrophosphorylase (carboxylating)